MNKGERDEYIFKIYLVKLRDEKKSLFGEPITSVGFLDKEYGILPKNIDVMDLNKLDDTKIIEIAQKLGICKASAREKSDIYINKVGVSLKSLSAAPAALVNHTTRPGFEFACLNANTSIEELDSIIDKYWELRFNGIISEDTKTSDKNCPFSKHKEYLKPILEYFLFSGTGSRICKAKAEYIIEFENPLDITTYKKLNPQDAIEKIWPKLIFSLRAKKGMPKNYDPNTYKGKNAESIKKWVRFHSGNYRGALHIRTK